jgi:hypothetical protein
MIGITGVATSGKDTLFLILQKFFKSKNLPVKRFALADLLKKDLNSFAKEKLDIDLFNLSPEDKELIRPILVSYGKIKRINTNGRYWIDKLKEANGLQNKTIIPIITDIRYQEYPQDECFWLKKENNGFLIHISRIHKGKAIPPANAEEEKNNKILLSESDYSFTWCTEKNIDILYENYISNLEEIYELYRRRL